MKVYDEDERLASGIYFLGKPCKRDHVWRESGLTLRRADKRDCVECRREKARAMHRSRPTYGIFRRKRTLLPGKRYSQSDVDRFWEHVTKGEGPDDCWLFESWAVQGYGMMYVQGRDVRAPRFSWELHYGSIPDGMVVMHTCDNPPCARPDHLKLGTQADNIADRDAKGRTSRSCIAVSHGPKMTYGTAQEIRKRYAAGESPAALAREYGKSKQTIYSAVKFRTFTTPRSQSQRRK